MTWPDAYYVSYTFDALNRLSGVLENGTTTLASYGYAANNDLTGLTQSFTGSSVTFGYGYNAAGQRTSVNVSDGRFLYHPPVASNVSYAPNGVNQYTTVGSASLTYDGNGNLTGDGIDSFGYDTENHLVSASALGNTIAYAYNPLGRRASKTVNTTVTTFVWAGNQTIADYDGAGTLLRRYVYGVGLDEPIVTITVSGTTNTKAYSHQDGLGSVVALSDGATGAVTDIYAYGPYGQSTTLASNAFRFTGRRLDAESGLYYYRARYYSSSLGRFLQTDPIGTRGGINLYAYVGNEPLNLVDSQGLAPYAAIVKLLKKGSMSIVRGLNSKADAVAARRAGRRTDLSYGDTSSASYGYAANDDLTGLTQSFTGSSVTFSYRYNAAGQRTSVNVSDASFLKCKNEALKASRFSAALAMFSPILA